MRNYILAIICVLITGDFYAQQIYKPVQIARLDTAKYMTKWSYNKAVQRLSDEKEANQNQDTTSKFPSVILFGSGSLSGNIDSTVASSGKLHVMFMPNNRWRIYAAINRGFKTDSLAIGETPPARNLLFPDANNMGVQLGVSHSLLLNEWNNPNGNKMQLVCVPFAEYLLQKRTFLLTDSAGSNSKTFFAGNLALGGGLDLNFFDNKKNSVCLETRFGFSLLNIANNDIEDFRYIFSALDTDGNKDLDDMYRGLTIQTALKINGAGLFYKYNLVNAANDLSVKGLTGGQHFFGIILTAQVWEN